MTKPWEDELLRANIKEAFEHFELAHENERLARELEQANAKLARLQQELQARATQTS